MSKKNFVVAYSQDEVWPTDDGGSEVVGKEHFGWSTALKVPEGTKIVDGKLYFGEIEVSDYQYYKQLQGEIPVWYCLRVSKEGRPSSFESGLDIDKHGRFILVAKGCEFSTWQALREFLDNEYSNWFICLEEPMRMNVNF